MTALEVPLERDEQAAFVDWLERVGLKFTAIPNSTYTPSHKQKAHNRRQGLRAGFPDLIVLVPSERSRDAVGRFLCIEMKRLKGGTISVEQRHWHAHINGLGLTGVDAVVARGAAEAIEYVGKHLKPGTTGSQFC